MKIELLNYTPDPEGTIVKATRTCYQSFEKQQQASDKRLLAHIVKNNESPLEFASFTFLLSGISRVASHQIVRHRIASYAQKSQRYVGEESFEYVTPPAISANKDTALEFKRIMVECQKAYNSLKKLGIKNEDARFLLPNACTTQLVCAFNARSLRHFIRIRSTQKAQWEIREIASSMKKLVENIAPALVSDL